GMPGARREICRCLQPASIYGQPERDSACRQQRRQQKERPIALPPEHCRAGRHPGSSTATEETCIAHLPGLGDDLEDSAYVVLALRQTAVREPRRQAAGDLFPTISTVPYAVGASSRASSAMAVWA